MNNDDIDQTNVGVGVQELENIRQSLGESEEWGDSLEDRFANVRAVERDFFDILGTYAKGVEATEQVVNNIEDLPNDITEHMDSIASKRDRAIIGAYEEEEGYFDPETQSWNKGTLIQQVIDWGPEESEKALYGVERMDAELDHFLDNFSELEGVRHRPEDIREEAARMDPEGIEYVAVRPDSEDGGISRRALLGGAGVVVAGLWARGAYLEGRSDVRTEEGLDPTEYSLVDTDSLSVQSYVAEMQGVDEYSDAFSEVEANVNMDDAEMGFAPGENRMDFNTNLDSTVDTSVLMTDHAYEQARDMYDNIG